MGGYILEIIKITIEDLVDIVNLYKDAIKKMEENNIFQWDEIYPDENILKDDVIKGQMYGIKMNNEIVCVFVINNEFDEAYLNGKWEYNQDNYKVIHRVCVKSNYQNKGIGTKAMIKIEEYLKNNNTGSIRLDAFSKNPYSLKMYNKLGYKKVGEANWRKGLFYLLEKIL
jgi:ribosomal protein S18 acetylase RimI-like enzyme